MNVRHATSAVANRLWLVAACASEPAKPSFDATELAERIATVDADNRWIGFPYPRLMNANAIIDQAAAVLVTSVAKAQEWGIPRDRWVFLHGCADGTDTWVVSEREKLDASPAIRGCAHIVLDMAGKKASDIARWKCGPGPPPLGAISTRYRP